jgi:hypothetical protein
MSVMCRPTASAAVYPNIASAARFHEVMVPSSVLLTIASSEESMMAASQAAGSTGGGRAITEIVRSLAAAREATAATTAASAAGEHRPRLDCRTVEGARPPPLLPNRAIQ